MAVCQLHLKLCYYYFFVFFKTSSTTNCYLYLYIEKILRNGVSENYFIKGAIKILLRKLNTIHKRRRPVEHTTEITLKTVPEIT